MNVVFPAPVLDEIRRHGEASYPEECCGFLIGPERAGDHNRERRIRRVIPAHNQNEGQRRRRFEIPPEQLRQVERSLEGSGEAVLGFYHSHPDHPAVPSQFDQDHAWPWYTYVVLAVDHGRSAALGAFELDAEARRFAPIPWSTEAGTRRVQ